jgi:site-specific DNA-methyltransferase (adenine-specific)
MPKTAQQALPFSAPRTKIRLSNEDCILGMRSIPDGSVDVVVTSPPYNLDIDYGGFDDSRSEDEYLAWTAEWTREVHRVLKDSGSFFLNIGAAPKDPWIPHRVILSLRNHWHLQNTFHWIKSITVEPRAGNPISVGHFKPLNSPRFVTDCHEFIFHLTKSGNVPLDRLAVGVEYADKSNIARWGHTKGKDKRCRGNNWFLPYDTIKSRDKQRPHPASFPVGLPERCIRLHGNCEEAHVMDPFLGIGNTALAALRCNTSRFTGFEINAGFLEYAKDRIADMTGTAER